MGALISMVIPAVLVVATSPTTYIASVAVRGAVAGSVCGTGHCRREVSNQSSITIMNGMGLRGVVDGNDDHAAGVAIYTSNDPAEDILQVERALLVPADDVGQRFKHTFNSASAAAPPPQRIYITNLGAAPLCIAGVTLTYPGGSYLTLSGELGNICDADTYESNVRVLPAGEDGDNTPPSCIWVDRNLSNGIRLPGIMLNLLSTTKIPAVQHAAFNLTSIKDLCRPPFMNMVSRSPPAAPGPARLPHGLPRRQLIDPVPALLDVVNFDPVPALDLDFDFDAHVVKSNHSASSATRMCENKFSRGPHFVSFAQNLFCDMVTRHIYPVCGSDVDVDRGVVGGVGAKSKICFDARKNRLVEIEEGDVGDDGDDEDATTASEDGERITSRGLVKGGKATRERVIKSFRYVDVWKRV